MSDQDRPGFDLQADDAATIMKMAQVFDVRLVEGADMDAIRDLLRRPIQLSPSEGRLSARLQARTRQAPLIGSDPNGTSCSLRF